MLNIKQACQPRPGTFDPARRDTVLDVGDLVEGHIDADEFLPQNYITEGLKTLLTEGFRRLEGKSSQGVFKLTQALGGGKTHNLLASASSPGIPNAAPPSRAISTPPAVISARFARSPSPGARAMPRSVSGVR